MKKLFLLLTAVLMTAACAMAQTQTVTGTVVYAGDNEPLAGATILPVGGGHGTATDIDGNFSLTIPTRVKKLQVSYVGMITQDVTIKSSNMLIKLDNQETNLDEVMVVAYGKAKKSAFTGSATVVKADQIEKSQVSNALDALKGRVAGVQITNGSGAPGSSPSIKVRGISSIKAGNDPLIILDGAPFNGDMNLINTNDIASMTVLKDAASTALYGARAANGVIIITTKAGQRAVNGRVVLDAKWGSNSRAMQDYNYIKDPAQYYEMEYTALRNYAFNSNDATKGNERASHAWASQNLIDGARGLAYNVYTTAPGQDLVGIDGKLNPNATLGRVISYEGNEYMLTPDNWLDAAYKHGLRQEYNLSVSNGNDLSSFYGSFGYFKNEGITPNSDFERITGRLSAESQIKPWLKASAQFNYTHYEMNSLDNEGESGSTGNIWAAATQVAPIYPLFIRNGQGQIMQDLYGNNIYDYGDGKQNGLVRPIFAQSNAICGALLDKNKTSGNSLNGMGSLEITFLKDFKFTSNNTVGLMEMRGNSVSNPLYGLSATGNGMVSVGHSRYFSYQFQQMLYWSHLFAERHNVSVTLVHENYWEKDASLSASKSNMYSPDVTELGGAITDGSMGSSASDYNNEGWMGRAEYDYESRYFASASVRRDGSSRFHPDHRWGTFWSLGGAWIISKENWFQAAFVDQLKIKASYGELGNDNIGNYRYTNVYDIVNSAGNPALTPASMGNPDITWEKNGTFNAGVEFSFFKERLMGSFEGFYRKTSDMLFSFPLPPSFGYTSYAANIGDMSNYGLELDINATLVRTRDIVWDLSFNITWYKNKISYLPEQRKTMTVDGHDGFSSDSYFYGEGLPMYTLYMKDYAGVDPNDGQALYYYNILDADGNPTGERGTTSNISNGDNYLLGTAMPKAYGGFGTSFNYKGIDLSVQFNYQLGGKIYDSGYASLMSNPSGSQQGSNFHADLLNAWTPQNTNTDIPRLQYGDQYATQTSSRFLTSASYLTLQNINAGYTLPQKWTRKAMLEKVRIYFAAENVWMWSKRQGLNATQSISGSTNMTNYAPMRTLSGGINLTF